MVVEYRRINSLLLKTLSVITRDFPSSILELLYRSDRPLTPTEISDSYRERYRRGLPPSSFFKFANEVVESGVVDREGGNYSLSPLGRVILDGLQKMSEETRPYFADKVVEDLRRKYGGGLGENVLPQIEPLIRRGMETGEPVLEKIGVILDNELRPDESRTEQRH